MVLGIDAEARARRHDDVLDVWIGRAKFLGKLGMIFRLDDQRVVGRRHRIGPCRPGGG
jgi:hypothetical protein